MSERQIQVTLADNIVPLPKTSPSVSMQTGQFANRVVSPQALPVSQITAEGIRKMHNVAANDNSRSAKSSSNKNWFSRIKDALASLIGLNRSSKPVAATQANAINAGALSLDGAKNAASASVYNTQKEVANASNSRKTVSSSLPLRTRRSINYRKPRVLPTHKNNISKPVKASVKRYKVDRREPSFKTIRSNVS